MWVKVRLSRQERREQIGWQAMPMRYQPGWKRHFRIPSHRCLELEQQILQEQLKNLEPEQKLQVKNGIRQGFDQRGRDLLKEKAAQLKQLSQPSPSLPQNKSGLEI